MSDGMTQLCWQPTQWEDQERGAMQLGTVAQVQVQVQVKKIVQLLWVGSLLPTVKRDLQFFIKKIITILDVFVDKEELIICWKLSASGFQSRKFLKDSSTLRDRAFFHNLAYICGGKMIGSAPFQYGIWGINPIFF